MSQKIDKLIGKAKTLHGKILTEAKKIPEIGAEFREGVQLTADKILATITEKKFVTSRQLEALQNMLTGVRAWTRQKKKQEKTQDEYYTL